MSGPGGRGSRATRWLAALVPLAVIGVYVGERLASARPWNDPRVGPLGFGLVEGSVLATFGAALPWRVAQGEVQRLVLDLFTSQTLLDVVLGVLFLRSSLARGGALFGAGATLAFLLLGGASAVATDTWVREGSRQALALGWFSGVLALTGGSLAFGLLAGSHPARVAVRRGAVSTLVFLAVLHVGLTWPLRAGAGLVADVGDHAMLAATGVGFAAGALLRPWRAAVASGGAGRVLLTLSVAVLGVAAFLQVQRVQAEATAPEAGAVWKQLRQLELDARAVLLDGPRATSSARNRLDRSRSALRQRAAEVVPAAHRPLLEDYLDRLDPLVTGDVPDPGAVRMRLGMAASAWYEAEDAWRRDVGLPVRDAYARRTWESR
ncbi:MAG: hypothetical protein AB7T63_01970 [Planctomycetota bacterium]